MAPESSELPPPPPYEAAGSVNASVSRSDADPNALQATADAMLASSHHHNAPPPAFTAPDSAPVRQRDSLQTRAGTMATIPAEDEDEGEQPPTNHNGYPDEKAMLKRQEALQAAPQGTHYCTTTTSANPYSSPAPGAAPAASSYRGPVPLIPAPSYAEPLANSGRRGFFRSSVSNLRDSLYAPRQPRPSITTAEKDASQMEHFARRLEAQNRMGPSAAEAEMRIRQLKLDAMTASNKAGPRASTGIFKAACSTDLLFLIDATGSMMSYIEAAKTQIKNIVGDINRTFFNEADVRVAVVAYRDHKDKKHIEFLDFDADVGHVFKFLDQLLATGGDDLAEDVLGGLDQALRASWKHQTRCIMHIADAPAHGRNLHDMQVYSDHYLTVGSEPHGLTYEPLIKKMVKQKINYVFFRIHESTDRMTYVFLEAYATASANCKLHISNKHHVAADQMLQSLRRRSKRRTAKTASAREYMQQKMEEEGGLHFEEVLLGTSYSSLRHLVVSSVTASSSRTAVRLSSSLSSGAMRSSYAKSKLGQKPFKLGNLAEDDEIDVFHEASQWQEELALRGMRNNAEASTLADTIVEEEEQEEEDEVGRMEKKDSEKDRQIEFDTDDPQWNKKGWLDQTMHVKAFSPDVIDISLSDASAGSILDRMMESDDNIRISTNELIIHRRTKPFAQGALRLASYARTQESTNPLVVKTFKAGGKRLADLAEDMRMQALCKAFALEFNSLVASEEHALDFVVVTCLQPMVPPTQEAAGAKGKRVSGGDGEDGEGECLSLEPMLLNGRFVKHNNNCGGVSDDQASTVNDAAQAFSHFTFDRSKGELLVVDLQGVGNVMTDPAIHTQDPARFVLTDTNLNADGFKLFFSTHRCNSVCFKLGLQSSADMFLTNNFAFRTDWPAATYRRQGQKRASASAGAAPEMPVCCSNKLCSKIVRVATANKTAPGFYWCDKCWPQLSSSTVKRVCATPGAYHEFEVSKFFFESQGQLMPRACPDHGGVPSLPVVFRPKTKGLGFFKRR